MAGAKLSYNSDIVIRYRMFWRTISYVAISYVKTYDIVLRYGKIEHTMSYPLIYDVATYDIVCLTYDVVCNILCRMFHIRCRILQSYATSYVTYDIVCQTYDIVSCDIVYHIIRYRMSLVYDIVVRYRMFWCTILQHTISYVKTYDIV